MHTSIHTAAVLDQHRAANLAREVELLRRQAERPEGVVARPSRIVIVGGWFLGVIHANRVHRAPRGAVAAR